MFHLLVYRPLINILSILTFLFKGNLGLAILVLGFLIRLCLYPLNRNILKHQQKLNKIQPQLRELQEKYKNDPQKFVDETRKLYEQEGIKMSSMFGGMFWQLLLLFLFFVFIRQAILDTNWVPYLYSFIKIPLNIDLNFLGILNLNQPNFYLLVFYFILTLIPVFLQLKATQQNSKSIMTTLFIFIFLFGIFLTKWQDFNAAVILSWIGMSLVSIIEALLLKPSKTK